MTIVAIETMPATRPATARVVGARRNERTALKIAKGAKMPKGSESRPSTRALVAPRWLMSLAASPELPAAAEEQIKDGPDAPGEGDDDPEHFPEPAHVFAVHDVDHG